MDKEKAKRCYFCRRKITVGDEVFELKYGILKDKGSLIDPKHFGYMCELCSGLEIKDINVS